MKVDLRVQHKELYKASALEPQLVTVPKLPFLMIDGQGDPAGPEFQDAVGTLYGTTYALKFSFKNAQPGQDFSVMPLEGLWWCEGIPGFDMDRKDLWRWTLMILQPDFVDKANVKASLAALGEKRGRTPAMGKLRLASFREGKAVQILHIGPYSAERTTIGRIEEYMGVKGLIAAGKHHEIYMSDPRRTAPEKLKTILRVPVGKASQPSPPRRRSYCATNMEISSCKQSGFSAITWRGGSH